MKSLRPTASSIFFASLGAIALVAAGCVGSQAEETVAGSGEIQPEEIGPLSRLFDFQDEPIELTIPAGTEIKLRFEDYLSSHTSQAGQRFQTEVVDDVRIDGETAIPRGARIVGRIVEASDARKIGGRAKLSLSFDSLELASGESIPLDAEFASVGKSQNLKDSAIIGGSTIAGAVLGEAVDEGEGTVVGAVVGGIAGALGAKKTRAKPVEIAAGTVVDIQLIYPIQVEV